MHGVIVEMGGDNNSPVVRRILIDTEGFNETLVMAIFRGNFVAWHEPPNFIEYVEKYKATVIGSIDVPDKVIAIAKMYIAMQDYFEPLAHVFVEQGNMFATDQ